MDKQRFFSLCVSMAFVVSIPVQAEVEFSYDKNTFINYTNCLGIYPGTSLKLQEEVWLFSMDESPMLSKVVHVISAAEAKKRIDVLGFKKASEDKQLWAEVGCANSFSGDKPESLARVTPEPKESISIGLAIRGLPAGAWISKGKGDSVSLDAKGNPFVGAVRHLVTDACYAPDSLIRVKQFPVGHGRAITQLDIGKIKTFSSEQRRQVIEEKMRLEAELYAKWWRWKEYQKEKREELERKDYVESVEICRFFLAGNRVLKSENISRHTGVDERVDTPTDLDADNWADTSSRTLGFISLNQGKDWDVLLVDVGFEGINYSIQRLNNSAVQYSRSLYTYH